MTKLRSIRFRERGVRHGPITRLISPHEMGERLKPFVFLDFFSADITPGFGFGMHPHSGIATLTWQPGCDVAYEDTTGQKGTLKAGGLEWMNAGGGAWHQGFMMGQGRATGFQLWVPMPPEVEDGPSMGQYVPPDLVPSLTIAGGEVKVLLGAFREQSVTAQSPINPYQDMNYLVLTLEQGASWRYQPPIEHDTGWAFVFEGTAQVQGETSSKELLVLDDSGTIEVAAPSGPVRMLIGTAKFHDHELVLGQSSVHTNVESLLAAEQRIREIGKSIRQAGR